jgi:hypothetical protein
MKGLTDFITEQDWDYTLTATYVLVTDHFEEAARRAHFDRTRGPNPDYDDNQIITIALAADFWFGGDEEKTLHFLRQYHATLWSNGIPDTSRFNVRRRELFGVIEALRRCFRDEWRSRHPLTPPPSPNAPGADLEARIRLADSAPVIFTSRGRGGRTPTIEPQNRAEWFGVCTSQDFKFFGARVHASVCLDQMLDEWVLAPGSYADIKVFPALCDGYVGLIFIADKAYVSEEMEARVWERGGHQLLPLRRTNQKEQWPDGIQPILGKLRHRIETAFSVLTTAFNLRFPHGRSFSGFLARTATKMLAYTISFFLAELVGTPIAM